MKLQQKRTNNGEYAKSEDFQFEPGLFKFLRDLKNNYDRPWLKANKPSQVTELSYLMMGSTGSFAIYVDSGTLRTEPIPIEICVCK